MEWIKVSVSTIRIGSEILVGYLMDLGIHGVEIKDPEEMKEQLASTTTQWDYIDDDVQSDLEARDIGVDVIFYLGVDDDNDLILSQIKAKIQTLNTSNEYGYFVLIEELVNDQDWLHEWKKHYNKIVIGNIAIVPEWERHTCVNEEVVFFIDPGSAFGTGQHPTTAMCIQALQENINTNDTVLDLGCGSGILSIISLLLGSKHVVSCDIDATAINVTKKNATLNAINLNDLTLHIGNILTDENLYNEIVKTKYDVIVANIVADVLISLASIVPQLLRPHGKLIASGIISERLDDVIKAFDSSDLKLQSEKATDGWHCVIAHG